jgi:hypothetical protein
VAAPIGGAQPCRLASARSSETFIPACTRSRRRSLSTESTEFRRSVRITTPRVQAPEREQGRKLEEDDGTQGKLEELWNTLRGAVGVGVGVGGWGGG